MLQKMYWEVRSRVLWKGNFKDNSENKAPCVGLISCCFWLVWMCCFLFCEAAVSAKQKLQEVAVQELLLFQISVSVLVLVLVFSFVSCISV
jgi:hypothetical protein